MCLGRLFAQIQLLELIGRDRLAVVVALAEVAGELLEHLLAVCRFHAFRHGGHIHIFGHGNDSGQDLAMVSLFVQLCLHHKGAVQLEFINVKGAKGVERGVTGPEVVHGNTEAVAVQFIQTLLDQLHILHSKALQDLQRDPAGGDLILGRNLPQPLGVTCLVEQQPGLIDRDGDQGQPLVQPCPDLTAGLLYHVIIQLDTKAVVFKEGDELIGEKGLGPVVDPADQGLGAPQRTVLQADLGLKEELERARCQSLLHVVFNVVLQLFLFVELGVIEGDGGALALFGHIQRHHHMAHQLFQGIVAGIGHAGSAAAVKVKGIVGVHGVSHLTDLGEHGLKTVLCDIFLRCFQTNQESVRRIPAEKLPFLEVLIKDGTHVPQQHVGVGGAEQLIAEFEFPDVDGHHGTRRSLLQPLFQQLEELGFVVGAGQTVIIGNAGQADAVPPEQPQGDQHKADRGQGKQTHRQVCQPDNFADGGADPVVGVGNDHAGPGKDLHRQDTIIVVCALICKLKKADLGVLKSGAILLLDVVGEIGGAEQVIKSIRGMGSGGGHHIAVVADDGGGTGVEGGKDFGVHIAFHRRDQHAADLPVGINGSGACQHLAAHMGVIEGLGKRAGARPGQGHHILQCGGQLVQTDGHAPLFFGGQPESAAVLLKIRQTDKLGGVVGLLQAQKHGLGVLIRVILQHSGHGAQGQQVGVQLEMEGIFILDGLLLQPVMDGGQVQVGHRLGYIAQYPENSDTHRQKNNNQPAQPGTDLFFTHKLICQSVWNNRVDAA